MSGSTMVKNRASEGTAEVDGIGVLIAAGGVLSVEAMSGGSIGRGYSCPLISQRMKTSVEKQLAVSLKTTGKSNFGRST